MRALVATPAATEPKITELPDPLAGPDDVVVQVIAAAVNPVDQMVAGGAARQAFGLDGAVVSAGTCRGASSRWATR